MLDDFRRETEEKQTELADRRKRLHCKMESIKEPGVGHPREDQNGIQGDCIGLQLGDFLLSLSFFFVESMCFRLTGTCLCEK